MGLYEAAGRLIGGAGKALSNVGYAVRGATGLNVRLAPELVPGGLGQKLQDIGGGMNPFNPKESKASEKNPSPGLDTNIGNITFDTPQKKITQTTNQPRPQPQPQPQPQPISGNFMDYYPGWGSREAEADFKQQYGGDINRLAQAKGGGSSGGGDYNVPSAEEAAQIAAEERMGKYNQLVAPVQKDIESYLTSRPDLNKLFQDQLTAQGVPARTATLGGFEKDVTNLQGQLTTIPTEHINRRKETGMLTAASERRIRSKEEQPIREQLLKSQSAVEAERVGLQRAYDLVDKLLDIQREQEKRGLEPLQTRLEAGKGEFDQEVEALATRLTGFTADREAQLDELKAKVAAGVALTKQEQQQGADLVKLEATHQNTMEEIVARSAGQKPTTFENTEIVQGKARQMAEGGASYQELLATFVPPLDESSVFNIYNQWSSNPSDITSTEAAKYQVPGAGTAGGGS